MDDHVLPPKSLAKACIQKKNKSLGWETRYILVGHTQLIIARDQDYSSIVNVIPLEGGFVIIRKPRDFGGLVIQTHQREYLLKFQTSEELIKWYHLLQSVVSKEISVQSYQTRKRVQDEKLSNLNKYTQYTKLTQDIEDKLVELKKLCNQKKRFERDNTEDEEIAEYIESTRESTNLH